MKFARFEKGDIVVYDGRVKTVWRKGKLIFMSPSKEIIGQVPSSHKGVVNTLLSDNTMQWKEKELSKRGWKIKQGDDNGKKR